MRLAKGPGGSRAAGIDPAIVARHDLEAPMTRSLLRLLPCLTLLAALVGCIAPEDDEEDEDSAEPSGFSLEPGEAPDEPDEPDLDLDGAREFSVAWIGATELVYEGIVYFMATSEPASCPDT
jgi:hypothetical protein